MLMESIKVDVKVSIISASIINSTD